MSCYVITCVITCHAMLYNMCYGMLCNMLYNICHVMSETHKGLKRVTRVQCL